MVEMKEQFSSRWTVAAKSQDTECKVTKLSTGKEYEFRVLAENKAGLSEPSRPCPAFVAKDAYGRLSSITLKTTLNNFAFPPCS